MAATVGQRFEALLGLRLGDEDAERVRRNHQRAISEMQERPAVSGLVIEDVVLASGTVTSIEHKLGRKARVFVSAIRGASTSGRIDETRSNAYDRSRYVVLTAQGWGATITVDLWVL